MISLLFQGFSASSFFLRSTEVFFQGVRLVELNYLLIQDLKIEKRIVAADRIKTDFYVVKTPVIKLDL